MRVTDKYVFFWQEYLSNWAIVPGGLNFNVKGKEVTVPCSESIFMIYKALYFKDDETLEKMLQADNPRDVKHLGREVKNFDASAWSRVSTGYMSRAVKIRFDQDERFRNMLLDDKYDGKTFVEASPYDGIWGVKMDENNPLIDDRKNWQGENRFGFVLTRLRNREKGSSESMGLEGYDASVEKIGGTSAEIFNKVIKYFSSPEVDSRVGQWIFQYGYKAPEQLTIEKIDPTNLNKEIIQKLENREAECEQVLKWITVPNYDYLPGLIPFGQYIDELYKFDKPIKVYRGIRTGILFKPKQMNMGLTNNDTFDQTLEPHAKRGYEFDFTNEGPMSVARSPWIAKVYGNVISKCLLPPKTPKLVITAELAYVLQKMQQTKYPQYRAINMSCLVEIVVFPGANLHWEVITTSGDISSELPQLFTLDADEDLLELEDALDSMEKLEEEKDPKVWFYADTNDKAAGSITIGKVDHPDQLGIQVFSSVKAVKEDMKKSSYIADTVKYIVGLPKRLIPDGILVKIGKDWYLNPTKDNFKIKWSDLTVIEYDTKKESASTEKLKDMPTFKLTKKDDELMQDKRYVRLLFMIKYVCKTNEYINPNSTFKELGITKKKYEGLHDHIFKNYYLGDIKELPAYNESTKFKDFAHWVIDHLKKVPKELIGTDPTQVKEEPEEESSEAMNVFKFMTAFDKKNLSSIANIKSLNDGLIENTYYQFSNFPYFLFVKRAANRYQTSRLEHMFQDMGNRTVRVHKFFIPELVYLLEELKFPQSMINDIYNNTWLGHAPAVTTKMDISLIEKNMKCKLYPHQREFIENYPTMKDTNYLRGYLLSFEQGLGKTITSLALMEALGKEKIIIFCPKNTMRETWGYHIETFYKEPQNVYYAYDKDMDDPNKRFYILNYEAIDKLDPNLFKNKKVGVIVDESHNFLRMASDRTANLISFVQNVDSKLTDILPMSGTPIKCNAVELLPMFYILDPLFDADALQTFKLAFGFNMKVASDVLHHRLERMMSRVTKDILNLPEKHETTLMVKMPTANRYTLRSVKMAISDFISDRKQYHERMMNQYNKDFQECLDWLKKDPISQSKEFNEWYETIVELSSGKNVTMYPKGWIAKINEFENKSIIPELPLDLRKKFKDSRAAIKYIYLKIRGEVLGGLLTQMRQEMTSEMMQAANLEKIVSESVKKTVIFTSYVDTLELVSKYFKDRGMNCMSIYGKTAKELTDNVKTFQTDPKVNPLIASLKMLSTGATLTAANTVIFLNKPWRSIEYDQASDRVHRIGQDTDVNVISLVLDTGAEGNLSTRMEDIMNYSSELFDGIVDGEDLISDEVFATLPRDAYALMEYAYEKLFVSDKNLLSAINSARPVNSKEALHKQLRPGDLLIVYRSIKNPDYLVDSIFSPLAKRIQGSSFTSIKIVGRNDKVYGFGVKVGGADFDKMSMTHFLDTCPGVLVLRRPQPFSEEELDRLFEWFDARLKKIKYSVAKLWKSLVTHTGLFNTDTTTQEQAQKFMKPMFCSTVLAYGFKAAGINDGITVNRDTVWPKDYVLRSAFRPIFRYFKKEEDAAAVLAPWEEPEEGKVEGSKELLLSDLEANNLIDFYGSVESFEINNEKMLAATRAAKNYDNQEAFMASLKPGDLVLAYRKQPSFMAKVVAFVNSKLQRNSFTTIKIVDDDPKYIIGYYSKMDKAKFSRVSVESFMKTCNACLVLRLPGGIPSGVKQKYFDWLHDKVDSTPYSNFEVAKSIVKHAIGLSEDTSTVQDTHDKSSSGMFCSNIIAYANKVCGINDGITKDRQAIWPIDFVINSSYKPVAKWFEDKSEAEKVFEKADAEAKENGVPSKETLEEVFDIKNTFSLELFGKELQDLEEEEYDLLSGSFETLVIKDKELYEKIKVAQDVPDRSQLASKLQPGDLIMVYRTYTRGLMEKVFNKLNPIIQGSSFTSIKIVYKDPSYVIGYGSKMEEGGFKKVNTMGFLETCNGAVVLRLPGGIPTGKAEQLWSWLDERVGKVDYYIGSIVKSLIKHAFHSKSEEVTEAQAKGTKTNMFCSTIFAYAFKASGINDGLTQGRDIVWPSEWVTKSNFRCIYRYFAPGEGADKVFHEAPKDAEGNPNIPDNLDSAKESISVEQMLNDVAGEKKEPEVSQEALTDAVIQKKKASILAKICKICDIIEPSGMNSARYKQIIGNMNSKEFDSFVEKIKKGDWQLDLIIPNLKNKITNESLLKAADAIDCKLMHKIWMRDEATGRKYLTDNEYMVLTLPIRRQQQFLDEKMSVPENDQKIDAMSGQVTGDDDSCSITNPEIQILAARGLDRTLEELVNIRGGNIQGYAAFKQAMEETGDVSLDSISPDFRPRISMVAEVMLKSMMLDNNITK